MKYCARRGSQQQTRFRATSLLRGRLGAVVEYGEICQSRKQANQIVSAVHITLPDLLFWNVMTTLRDAGPDASDVQIYAFEPNVSHVYFHSGIQCLPQKSGNGASAECSLESVVEPFRDGALEQSLALEPRGDVGL